MWCGEGRVPGRGSDLEANVKAHKLPRESMMASLRTLYIRWPYATCMHSWGPPRQQRGEAHLALDRS